MPSDESLHVVRRPRYVPFIATGFALGVVATLVLVSLPGPDADSPRKLALYLGILLGGIGALCGGALAVWLERDQR